MQPKHRPKTRRTGNASCFPRGTEDLYSPRCGPRSQSGEPSGGGVLSQLGSMFEKRGIFFWRSFVSTATNWEAKKEQKLAFQINPARLCAGSSCCLLVGELVALFYRPEWVLRWEADDCVALSPSVRVFKDSPGVGGCCSLRLCYPCLNSFFAIAMTSVNIDSTCILCVYLFHFCFNRPFFGFVWTFHIHIRGSLVGSACRRRDMADVRDDILSADVRKLAFANIGAHPETRSRSYQNGAFCPRGFML